MCTLCWLGAPGGYAVYFNRDERRTRRPGLRPVVSQQDGVRFVAPRDGDHGGTWIAVNQHGVTVALLNVYTGPPAPGRESTSRGLLVLGLAIARSVAEAESRLRSLDRAPFQPFQLALFGPAEVPRAVHWDGTALDVRDLGEADRPLTSSGYDAGGAARSRRAEFRRLSAERGAVDAALLEAFHRSHAPERGALSPCMHREEAATVSFTRVFVERGSASLVYHPAAPCEPAEDVAVDLARSKSAAYSSGRAGRVD